MIPYEVIKDDKSDMTKIKCGYCSKIFKTVQQHEQHRCRKENNFNAECLSCKKPYNDHAVENEDSLPKDVKASKDDTGTSSEEKAETTPEEPNSQLYRCCVCHKDYPNIPYLIRHIKYHMTKKSGAGAFVEKCSHCDKKFTTKQQLTRHRAAHDDIRPFKCEKCDKCFKTADSVRRHVYVHSDERPFSCQICSKEFKAKHLMKKHEETHSNEKNYECPKCGKKFKAKNSLRDHLLVHNGTRPYKCDQCEQAFYRRSHLATHRTVHSEVKPFSCKVCEKCFGRREHLKVHERIHSGEKPFKCTQCERSFNQQAGLQAHLVSHSDERPYTCLKCRKTFKYQSQIKHHACKRDEIGPCMVDVHGDTTMEADSPIHEPTMTQDSPDTATTSQDGQEIEAAPSTAEMPNVTSPSNIKDTIIFIQIENTSYTDENATSVDIVTTQENHTNIPETNSSIDSQVAMSEAQENSEGRPANNRNIQSNCNAGAGNITRNHKDISGSDQTDTQINVEGRPPTTMNTQARYILSPGNVDISLARETVMSAQINSDRSNTKPTNVQARFPSAADMTGTNVGFSETCAIVTETPVNSQGRYVDDTNTLARYALRQANITSAHQYNCSAESVRAGAFHFVEGTQSHISVNQPYMSSSHGHTIEGQGNNLTPQEDIVWPHSGLTAPLMGIARTTEQRQRILPSQLHQPVQSGANAADTTARHPDILSGLPHLWNRN